MDVTLTLNCVGLSCPMPVVKTKKAMNTLQCGDVLEIVATDKGSLADLKAWSESTGNRYLESKVEAGTYYHYIQKDDGSHCEYVIATTTFDEALSKLDETNVLIDVREEEEYHEGHIFKTINIPLGVIEKELDILSKDKAYYVVCRTGRRSNLAAELFVKKGFTKVYNVLPGMSGWTGEIVKG